MSLLQPRSSLTRVIGCTALVTLLLGSNASSASASDDPIGREDHPDWVLHSRIVDSKSSRPVGGAQIEIEFNNIDDPSNNRPFRDRFRKKPTRDATDERGRFDFTIKNYYEDPLLSIDISVEHPDFIPYQISITNPFIDVNEFLGLIADEFQEIRLVPYGEIRGRVVDSAGSPVSDLEIKAAGASRENAVVVDIESLYQTKTERDGSFRLEVPALGPLTIVIDSKPYAPIVRSIAKNQRGELGDFVINPGLTIEGRMIDTAGKPIPNRSVSIRPAEDRSADPVDPNAFMMIQNIMNHRTVLTNDRGEFVFSHMPTGEFEIERDSSDDDERDRSDAMLYFPVQIHLKSDRLNYSCVVNPAHSAIVSGRFVDSEGSPVHDDIHIYGIYRHCDFSSKIKSDRSGLFMAKVPHGADCVFINFSGDSSRGIKHRKNKSSPYHYSSTIDLPTIEGDLRDLEAISYRSSRLRMKVRGVESVDLDKVKIFGDRIKSANVENPFGFGFQIEGDRFVLISAEYPEISSICVVPDCDVRLTAEAEGYEPASKTVNLKEGEFREIEFLLKKKTKR